MESRRALPACYDFPIDGSTAALFSLPIPAGPGQQGLCLGALTLAFKEPGELDGPHARNLLLLSRALAAAAPSLEAAAAPLLQQCSLVLGCDVLPSAAEAEAAEAGSSASSSELLFLTDSEGEEEALGGPEEEEGMEESEAQREAPQWAAGSCRDRSPQPPEDPGSGAAALAVPSGGTAAPAAVAMLAQHAGGGSSRSRGQLTESESPSAIKARAKTLLIPRLSTGASASSAAESQATFPDVQQVPPSPRKPSPSLSETSSSAAGEALAAEAGATWRRLLRFADPQLERRFALWHYGQLWAVSYRLIACRLSLWVCMHPGTCI